MSLQVHRAERSDRLAAGLAEVLARPLDDVFAQEVVAVPARGVERWLTQRLSHRLGRTPAQVIVRWHLQHGVVVIPKSRQAERIRSNADVGGFELSTDDMAALDALGKHA